MPRPNAKRLFFFFLLATILAFSHPNTVQCENSQAEAEQAMSAAETHINGAFTSIRTAEEAGANVEDLIDELNAALNLTRKGQAQFLSGNFSESITLASKAIEIAEEVTNQADIRREEALRATFLQKHRILILLVTTDAIICLIGVFLIHRWQRRSLMKKKPKLAHR